MSRLDTVSPSKRGMVQPPLGIRTNKNTDPTVRSHTMLVLQAQILGVKGS